jgi:Lon protease-like protein
MQKTQLALFPLQLFLLPGERTNLHIFEDRYRQLLEDCESSNIMFGIPYAENGYLSGIGCVVKLNRILKKYENGSSDIEVEATEVFRIDQFYTRFGEKLYPGGDVSVLEQNELEPISVKLLGALDSYLTKANINFRSDISPVDMNVYQVATILDMPQKDKIKIAKARSLKNQEKVILNHIAINIKLLEQTKSIEGNIFLN